MSFLWSVCFDCLYATAFFPNPSGICEEGVWRKSGNFARIKRLQRELTILTSGFPAKKSVLEEKKSQSKCSISSTSAKSASSVSSLESTRSLSSSINSLDEIDDDDCDYSVHDMTTTVKRMLVPELLSDPSIQALLSLMDMLSNKVPENVLSCPDESAAMVLFREKDPRLFSNFVSCLSLFTLFHSKVNHSLFPVPDADSDVNLMSIFCSFMDLMSVTIDNCNLNKMVASNVATLLLPLFYPSSTDMTTSPVEGGFKARSNRQLFMLSFLICQWKQISSPSSLPNTFMTDFKKLMAKKKKRKSGDVQSDDENEVMSTCVRFAVSSTGNPFAKTSGISETELELARLYAHVQASQDKKMIKKLNRAGVTLPASAKKVKNNPTPVCIENPNSKTPMKTPKLKMSLKSIFSSAKKRQEQQSSLKNREESSLSARELFNEESPGTASTTPSNSFEVLRFT